MKTSSNSAAMRNSHCIWNEIIITSHIMELLLCKIVACLPNLAISPFVHYKNKKLVANQTDQLHLPENMFKQKRIFEPQP